MLSGRQQSWMGLSARLKINLGLPKATNARKELSQAHTKGVRVNLPRLPYNRKRTRGGNEPSRNLSQRQANCSTSVTYAHPVHTVTTSSRSYPVSKLPKWSEPSPLSFHLLGLIPGIGPVLCYYLSYRHVYIPLRSLDIGGEDQQKLRNRMISNMLKDLAVRLSLVGHRFWRTSCLGRRLTGKFHCLLMSLTGWAIPTSCWQLCQSVPSR